MKAYRKTKSGYIEEINTDGNYLPKGWSRTKQIAEKRLNK